ncbi:hypothetical protein [Spartinivicinus ruber]|uniref:hypothetical protein n=1 Tax=Spartinivicinus ruber TaxID=2683272 RepID=UPI0013D4A21C|nr:hypothetical protein [Spartinivicinus ruber]
MNKQDILTQLIGIVVFSQIIVSNSFAEPLSSTQTPVLAAIPPVQLMDWGDTIRISLTHLPPKVSLFKVKHGATEITDCNDQAGYKIPFWSNILLNKEQLPMTLCVVAYDLADNSSVPWVFALK